LGQIGIYFELYPHFGPGPAESAILAKAGPGVTTSGLRGLFTYLFGPNRDKHDILLIDDRGSGFSCTIDCPSLQHGAAPYEQSVAECAAQLGEAASRYARLPHDLLVIEAGYTVLATLTVGAIVGGLYDKLVLPSQ